MPYTVKDVLNLNLMKKARVRTAENTLHTRAVSSVSVIEMPVEDFVQKHELVLTTAIGCNNDDETFRQFVLDIIRSEAAALVIATGRHVVKIPEHIIQLADRYHFPIIETPWEIRFSDITCAVLSRLNDWHKDHLKRSEELQRVLLNLFLSGATLSNAAEAIHQKLSTPVVITDKKGMIKGHSKKADLLIHSIQSFLQTSRMEEIFQQESSIAGFKIQTAHKVQGYLFFPYPSETAEFSPDPKEEQPLQHALTALALWFQREDAIEETKTHLKDEFVWSLAKGEIEDWDKAATRAKSFNYNIHLPYVCILSIPENMETLFNRSASGGITYDHWLFDQICLLEEQMIEAGEMLKRKVMTTYHQEHFVIFLETDTDRVHESIGKYLNLVEKKVKNLLPGLVMSWGIGENHAGVKTFSQSYNDARIALYIGRRQKGPGHRSTYANTGIFRALFALSKNPEMEEIALSTIGSLIDYENQRGLDLIHTLTMYIRHKGNISQTSRALNLHRQSLVYRLRKIESLTGRSLENPDDLFLLDLSIKLWTTGMVLNQK
jgi:PucR family transcriptional regulator, purine catabolism regulatory protein